tara:strand:- start:1272 stop:1793 length:522 start_codon:yes stop_codon:yes gene_type:complete
MNKYNFDESSPKISESVFIAPNASLIGRVKIGDRSSVWFNSVLRGDVEQIQIGEETNFQDLSIGHADPGFPLIIGNRVTVGHRSITHGCEIQDYCLIGMGAILMNGVKISRGSIVGAGSTVLEGTIIPPFSLIVGSPAKIIKTYDENIIKDIEKMSMHYVKIREKYLRQFVLK